MEIELCGYKVLIDEEDYEKIKNYNWSVNIKNGNAYFLTTVKKNRVKTTYSLHRTVASMKIEKNKVVDHKNGDTLDNRKINLRICTTSENNRNRKINKNNTTGYKGVCYERKKGKYKAQIEYLDRHINLGYYESAEQAHSAYCEASKKYHGEFGRTE